MRRRIRLREYGGASRYSQLYAPTYIRASGLAGTSGMFIIPENEEVLVRISHFAGVFAALNNLHVLEREEGRLATEGKKRILQQTVQKLKTIARKFGESEQQ